MKNMKRLFIICCIVLLSCPALTFAETAFESETIKTTTGELEITFIGHSSLMFTFDNKVIHIDPWSKKADYATLPKADIILLTHHHRDHLDEEALGHARTDNTRLIYTAICTEKVKAGQVMANGDTLKIAGIKIEAVPAYNLVNKRENGEFYHPKGEGNGYVLTFGDTRVYIGGDTENVPEIKALKDIDYAFLPMNLPYTMTPEMVADAAKAFRPAVLYPYHYGKTDTGLLVDLLKGEKDIEVRVKKM